MYSDLSRQFLFFSDSFIPGLFRGARPLVDDCKNDDLLDTRFENGRREALCFAF